MSPPQASSSLNRKHLLALLLLAALVRLWVAWQPIESLVEKNLPDDSFYYFVLARNLAESGQATVDGVSPTNGFHPLWLLVITPLFMGTAAGAALPIHLALSLAALFDVASVYFLVRLGQKLSGRGDVGLIAGLLYAINPSVILQATNGLETALGTLTLLLFLKQLEHVVRQPSQRNGVWLGLLAGLMLLARTDAAFLFALALLALLLAAPNAARLRLVLTAGIVSVAVMLPWLLWSHAAVGSLLQESGVSIPYTIRTRLALEHGAGLAPQLRETLRQLASPAAWLRGDFSGVPLAPGLLLWALALLGLRKRGLTQPQKLILLPLLLSSLMMILFHAGLRWYPRLWYFVPTSAAFALCAALAFQHPQVQARLGRVLLALTAVYFLASGILLWRVGFYPWQRVMLAASTQLQQQLSLNDTLASFNSGIYSYYLEQRVVNLDGVVNHHAFNAIQQNDLLAYMRSAGVDYLVDTDSAVRREFAPFLGPDVDDLNEAAVLTEDVGYGLGAMRLYRIQP